jgi:alpha-L-fucosidase
MPDGRIEARQVNRLKEMGSWLSKYGESIYGTRGGPWKPQKAVASTRKGNTVFLHVLRWDGESLVLPDIGRKVKQASLFGGGRAGVTQNDGKLVVGVPPAERDAVDTVIRLELEGSAMDIPSFTLGSPVKATASNVYRNDAYAFGPGMAFDNDSDTRWATDTGTRQAWIAVASPRILSGFSP